MEIKLFQNVKSKLWIIFDVHSIISKTFKLIERMMGTYENICPNFLQ